MVKELQKLFIKLNGGNSDGFFDQIHVLVSQFISHCVDFLYVEVFVDDILPKQRCFFDDSLKFLVDFLLLGGEYYQGFEVQLISQLFNVFLFSYLQF